MVKSRALSSKDPFSNDSGMNSMFKSAFSITGCGTKRSEASARRFTLAIGASFRDKFSVKLSRSSFTYVLRAMSD